MFLNYILSDFNSHEKQPNLDECSIQFISDIHLEFYGNSENFNIIPHSPNLALCGDIGYPNHKNYRTFIIRCSQLFKNVFVIFGNHEFYNTKNTVVIDTMENRKALMNNYPPNVYFLDNRSVYLDVITNEIYSSVYSNNENNHDNSRFIKLLGSTLWSNIDYYTASKINDTQLIYTSQNFNERKLDYRDIKRMYNENINWILYEINKEPNIPCILLTHHAVHPIFLNKELIGNPRIHVQSAYVNWIPELYENKNLIACICGHTHYPINFKHNFENNSIYFLSNPVGYKRELSHNPEHDPNNKWNCLFKFNIK